MEKYAKQYDVSEHVPVILAMMLQESSGRGKDPMQSSESICGEKNCIDNRTESIERGIQYFAEGLEKADGDLELAIQAYNFGHGFISFVQEKDASYHLDHAIAFSQQMYTKYKDEHHYSCLREEAKQYNACYGDIYYVRDVLYYADKFSNE